MQSQFFDFFDGKQIGWKNGRSIWITNRPLRYYSALLKTDVVIPAEFITDHASVPRLPIAWLVAGGRGVRSATLHDFPYQFGFWLLPSGEHFVAERDLVDQVFYESLLVDPISGAENAVASIMYGAVRVGGRGVWASRRAEALNPIWHAGGVESP